MALLTIPYPTPLLAGTLVRRFNRFMAEVDLDSGPRVLAHCVNTGRMETLTWAGTRVWLSKSPSKTRMLQYTWEIAEVDGVAIGANTIIPNKIVGKCLQARVLRGFTTFDEARPEVPFGDDSRVDFLLRKGKKLTYIEVKNCHLAYPDRRGYFPDSVSERATKHLHELSEVVAAGHRAVVIFTAQRTDARAVRPSDIHDPEFAKVAREAAAAGVEFKALMIRPTAEALIVEKWLPVELEPYDTTRQVAWMKANRAKGPAWVTVKREKPQQVP